MKLTCPSCGASMSLDIVLANEGAREAIMLALRMPAPIGKLLVQYVALFRPASRSLSFDRVAGLLSELLPMIEAARIERSGRTWAAPQEAWRAALDEILSKRDKLTLPLKSHGYLLEILAGYANKAEAKDEAKIEADRKNQYHRPHQPSEGPKRARMPDEIRTQLKQLAKGGQSENAE